MKLKIKAFTLSEVLITLVVIGVVAAITVPVISSLWQKETLKTAFTKAYSDLNSISRKFYSDKAISFSEYANVNGYDASYTMLDQYIKFNHNDPINKGMYDSEGYVFIYKNLKNENIFPVCDDRGLYPDISGRLIGMNNPPELGENGPVICMDTNGRKGPNKYGYDYFLFIFTVDGRVIPMGMEDKNNTMNTGWGFNFFRTGSSQCSKQTGESLACAYYALNDIHPQDSSKSYWKDFL